MSSSPPPPASQDPGRDATDVEEPTDYSNLVYTMSQSGPKATPTQREELLLDFWVLNYDHARIYHWMALNPGDNDKIFKRLRHYRKGLRSKKDNRGLEYQKLETNMRNALQKLPAEETANWTEPVRKVTVQGHHSEIAFTAVRPGWDKIDFLMPSSEADEVKRYNSGWEWVDNSCAVDSLLCLAIHLNAWRIRADQTPTVALANVGIHWLRSIARLSWGTYDPDERGRLRDLLIKSVREDLGYGPGAQLNLQRTYDYMFAKLPQVSCLSVMGFWCRDESGNTGPLRLKNFRPISHFVACVVSRPGIKEFLQSAFSPQPHKQKIPSTCTHVEDHKLHKFVCKEQTKQVLIIGRLPPIIVVYVNRDFWQNGEPLSWSDPGRIPVDYASIVESPDGAPILPDAPVSNHRAEYELQAAVYFGNEHFLFESNLQKQRTHGKIHMDMLRPHGIHRKGRVVPTLYGDDSWKGLDGFVPELLVFKACPAVVSGDDSR